MIFDVNGAAGRMLGYGKAELLQRRLAELCSSSCRPRISLGDRARVPRGTSSRCAPRTIATFPSK
jgi:hypothetical protein